MSELEKRVPSKDEAIEFTANMRDAFENFCNASEAMANFLRESHEVNYWKGAGYESWQDWYHTEYEDQLEFLQGVKLKMDVRADIIQSLAEGGLSNRAIASTLGVNEKTVRNDLKASREVDADFSASNEVDAAGQSVEEVGHIDGDELGTQNVTENRLYATEISQSYQNTISEADRTQNSLDDRFAGIDFGSMVLPTPPQQIIETDTSEDTPDYFVPRQGAPSWSPPRVAELPSPAEQAYDDPQPDSPEFLEPPMKLQNAGEVNKTPEDKHCRTCACQLLP